MTTVSTQRLVLLATSIVGASTFVLTIGSAASAQRRVCVEETSPPPTAGEQAECWFGRQSFRNAATWCTEADLSDEAMGNLCFAAFVRAGRFEDAARVAGTLERVRPAARTCHAVFTTGLRVRIVPSPSSGVVHVDDESYGTGAAEVLLAPPFWDHRVSVRFDSRRVALSTQRLRRAVDTESCAATDIVVAESSGGSSGGGVPVGGIVLVAAGGVAVVAGAVLLVLAANDHAFAENPERDSEWADVEAARDRVTPFTIVGAASLTLGAIAAAAGIGVSVGLFDGDEEDRDRPSARLRITPSAATIVGTF